MEWLSAKILQRRRIHGTNQRLCRFFDRNPEESRWPPFREPVYDVKVLGSLLVKPIGQYLASPRVAAKAAALSFVCLAGCGQSFSNSPAQNPDTPTVEVADSNDQPSTLQTEGMPPTLHWDFQESAPLEWAFGGVKPELYWPESGGMGVRSPLEPAHPDVVLRSQQLDIPGKDYPILKIDLECIVSAELNDLTVYYSTASHNEAQEFRALPENHEALVPGERRVLTYDLTRLRMGGTDWIDSVIQRVRFDFPQGAGSQYVLHSIRLCAASEIDC